MCENILMLLEQADLLNVNGKSFLEGLFLKHTLQLPLQ